MSDITNADIDKLARLSRLEFNEEAKGSFASDLSKIKGFISILNAVDTAGVKPLTSVLETFKDGPVSTPERVDEVTQTPDRDAYQALAPNSEMGFYVVPKVIE